MRGTMQITNGTTNGTKKTNLVELVRPMSDNERRDMEDDLVTEGDETDPEEECCQRLYKDRERTPGPDDMERKTDDEVSDRELSVASEPMREKDYRKDTEYFPTDDPRHGTRVSLDTKAPASASVFLWTIPR